MGVFIFKYFWIAGIVVTVANALIMRSRSKSYIRQNPELQPGYDKIFKTILIYGNIPWIIMGIGILTGLTNSMFSFFFPRSLNPVVLVFHASIIVIWILSVRWIYFQKGAEMLESHPGLLNGNPSAHMIKIFAPLALAGGIAGMIAMWAMKVPDILPFP